MSYLLKSGVRNYRRDGIVPSREAAVQCARARSPRRCGPGRVGSLTRLPQPRRMPRAVENMIAFALVYLGIGAVAGVLAGLLGVGGGLIIVPLLVATFSRQGLPAAHLMHLALGTSLASIVFTSVSSFRAHHRRGAVEWGIVRRITPGILAGTFGGSWIASRLSTAPLTWVFTLFLYAVSVQMFLDRKPRPTRAIPGAAGTGAAGALIGVISSLVGIGGGSLSVPF